MCCVEWFAGTQNFNHVKFCSKKFLGRCLEILGPAHHIATSHSSEAKNFTLGAATSFSENWHQVLEFGNFSGDAKHAFYTMGEYGMGVSAA